MTYQCLLQRIKSVIRIIFLWVLCNGIFIPSGYGQSTKMIDSLRQAFRLEQDPIKKSDIYYDLAFELENQDLELIPAYADTLEEMSKKSLYLKGAARAYSLRGFYQSEKGNYDSAIAIYRHELPLRIQMKDSLGIARVYNFFGTNFKEQYKSDSAIHYLLKATEINETLKEYKNVASGYANIGNLFADLKLHDKSIEYLKKALNIRLTHGDEKGAVFTYNNLAVAFGSDDQTDSALFYYQKGIDLALKYDNFFVAGVIQGGMSELYNNQSKYAEAIRSSEKSLELLTKVNRKANMVYPYINLASSYNLLKQPKKALQYAEAGYKIMQELKLLSPIEVYYEQFALAHELLGNDNESLSWYKKFVAIDDSLYKADNTKSLAEAEAKYQNQIKETSIALQKLELNTQANKLFKQKTWITGLISGLLGLVLFSTLYFHRFRLKKKTELDAAIIQEQKQGLNAVIAAQEEERKRIAKDLHDGIAQELVALKLGVSLVAQKIKSNATITPEKIDQISRQLDETTKEVRNLAHTMVPPTLEQKGLAPTLELLLDNTLKNAGVDYKISIDGITTGLNDKINIGIYRIAQEMINNIIKHSQAKNVLFILALTGNQLTLQVQDDGLGFKEDELKNKTSMGILNIVSRVATLGGSYKFENIQPHGTNSTITIPIEQK